MKEKILVEGFYRAVADALGCVDHEYREYPYRYKTRWNNRESGNGRYPGHGIVRRFSADTIQVHLYNPLIGGLYNDFEKLLCDIRKAAFSEGN